MIRPKLEWNVGDVFRRFGPISLGRIRQQPPPGSATEEDLIAINERKAPLYELIDGILLEKPGDLAGAFVATSLIAALCNFVRPKRLGVVVGSGVMIRIRAGVVRVAKVAFASRDRFPDRRLPSEPISTIFPNLAVEVLSRGNTKKEMAEKLLDYFGCGVEIVWYVDPAKRTARVFTGPDDSQLLREKHALDGGTVLPGFILPLRELFADPLCDEPNGR